MVMIFGIKANIIFGHDEGSSKKKLFVNGVSRLTWYLSMVITFGIKAGLVFGHNERA